MPYLNVVEVESALAVAAASPNTGFTQLITLPNPTWEGRTCHAIKIAGGAGAGRTGVYFLGGVHAREWGSADILINFVEKLTAAYRTHRGITLGGKRFTAAQVRRIVDRLDIFVFAQVNPDGRQESFTGDAMWRKNRRPGPASHTGCPGVDVNRNYDFLWNFKTYFSPAAPIANSTDPCDPQVYIGPSAASEPETTNVVWLADTNPHICYFVDVHSYGEDILYTWGDDRNQTSDPAMNFHNPAFNGQRGIVADTAYREYIDSADQATIVSLANGMHDAIEAVRGRAYEVKQSLDLYPTAGTSDDYFYSRHIVDPGKARVFAYTIEWGSDTNPTPFHPPYAEMRNIIREVTAGLLEFCLRVA